MVVVPADMPLTESCAEPGMDVLEAGSVTVWLAAGGLPSFATLAVPEVRVTFTEFARGIDVVTLIVPVPSACTETPPDGDKIMVGGGGVMVNEELSATLVAPLLMTIVPFTTIVCGPGGAVIVAVPLMANAFVTEMPSKASVGEVRIAPVHFVDTLTGHVRGVPRPATELFFAGL